MSYPMLGRCCIFGLLLAAMDPLCALEIATGSMLGPRFKQEKFYVRSSPGTGWRLTYEDGPYRSQARGKLMVLRLAQALYDDEWLTETEFDAEANTDRVIASLDTYKSHGVLAIAVSLQGGNPGYDAEANGIARRNGQKYGEEDGLLVSAFEPDGTLKKPWLERLARLIEAADERGMVICLMYFYQGQDEVFESPRAIVNGSRNITAWLIEQDYRNVIIDVANEWNLSTRQRWDHGNFIPENVAGIVFDIREQFVESAYTLPIGASTDGRMLYPASMAKLCDLVMVHGNGRGLGEKRSRLDQIAKADPDRAVWMNEDDNGKEPTEANLQKELASADLLFERGAGWGYMPWAQAQQFPFDYAPGESADFTDDLPLPERKKAYFKAVLEHMARLTLKKPPSTRAKTD